jgi:hypothetical protein
VNRRYRSRHANTVPSWGPGWDQPHPGWTPLLDHGPLPLRAAGSVARWWWPTLAVAGFLAVAVYVTGHDPSLSRRGLLTIALAALVVVLLTIHRSAGASRLARATAEYTVVALLAAMLTLTAAGAQQLATPAAKGDANQPATADASQERPWVLRVAAGVIRAVTKAIRAVTGAARWVADLWRQADAKTDQRRRTSSTTTPNAEAMAPPPALASTSTSTSTRSFL